MRKTSGEGTSKTRKEATCKNRSGRALAPGGCALWVGDVGIKEGGEVGRAEIKCLKGSPN